LDIIDIAILEADITNEEIRSAVFDMSPWKAPGPDRFLAGFYQHSWDSPCVILVKNIWKAPSGIAMVNQTDICLIPKVDQPEFVSQFWPISLGNTIYKISLTVVHSMHMARGSKEYFAIKVDLSKAYDRISWEYIWRVLVEIKLPDYY
jgi:hypothetical protein